MILLLDTHTFMWWDSSSSRLPLRVKDACDDRWNTLILSVASLWEIQIKSQLGKLHLARPLAEIVSEQQRANQVEILPVSLEQVIALQQLPMAHGDPFDRLLAAVARVEGAALASGDPIFRQYPVTLFW